MKGDQLLLYNSHKTLVFKVRHSENVIYKTRITIGGPICLHGRLGYRNWLCYARLGHANFEKNSNMSKKDLVIGLAPIIGNNQLRESCRVGKHS